MQQGNTRDNKPEHPHTHALRNDRQYGYQSPAHINPNIAQAYQRFIAFLTALQPSKEPERWSMDDLVAAMQGAPLADDGNTLRASHAFKIIMYGLRDLRLICTSYDYVGPSGDVCELTASQVSALLHDGKFFDEKRGEVVSASNPSLQVRFVPSALLWRIRQGE